MPGTVFKTVKVSGVIPKDLPTGADSLTYMAAAAAARISAPQWSAKTCSSSDRRRDRRPDKNGDDMAVTETNTVEIEVSPLGRVEATWTCTSRSPTAWWPRPTPRR